MEPSRYFLQIIVAILLVNRSQSFNIDDNCPRIFHHVFNGFAPVGKTFFLSLTKLFFIYSFDPIRFGLMFFFTFDILFISVFVD